MFGRRIYTLLFITFLVFLNLGIYAQSVKTGKYKGLQISRTDLINSLTIIDSPMHFKEVPYTKGLPKLTAKGSYGARIEIIGSEDNIIQTQWTVSQPKVGTLSKDVFNRMAFFVNTLAKQEGANWFFQQSFSYNQNPTIAISNLTTINGCKLLFIYDPAKKQFNITISPE